MREFYIPTRQWVIARYKYNKRSKTWTGEVYDALPCPAKKWAWINAECSTGHTRAELRAEGWEAQRLIITGKQ